MQSEEEFKLTWGKVKVNKIKEKTISTLQKGRRQFLFPSANADGILGEKEVLTKLWKEGGGDTLRAWQRAVFKGTKERKGEKAE